MTDGTGSAVGIGGDSGVGGSAAGSDTFGRLGRSAGGSVCRGTRTVHHRNGSIGPAGRRNGYADRIASTTSAARSYRPNWGIT